MTPWNLLDSAQVPGDGGELHLYQRGDEFSIRIAGRGELMNSRAHGSEDALAELACARLGDNLKPRLLIGGLGMGFTLAAALRHVGDQAEVVVAELVRSNELQAKPEQIKSHIEELAASYEKPAEVVRWYYGDAKRMGEVEAIVIENNVTDFILTRAKVTDKAIAFDDLMGQG